MLRRSLPAFTGNPSRGFTRLPTQGSFAMRSVTCSILCLVALSPAVGFRINKHQNPKSAAVIPAPPLDRLTSGWDIGFKRLDEQYWAKYSEGTGRKSTSLKPRSITLDFEVETGRYPPLTPAMFLKRGGVDAQTLDPWANETDVGIDVDGTGFSFGARFISEKGIAAGVEYAQHPDAMYELTTPTMSPQSFVNASFVRDMDGLMNSARRYTNGVLQYTVGVPLDSVPALLAFGNKKGSPLTFQTINKTEQFCDKRRGCDASYKGLLMLATTVLAEAHQCAKKGACPNPKRCMKPWLVRTNFADMLAYVQHQLGDVSMKSFTSDVLSIWGGDADQPIYPHGFRDYLHFPEMAEIGGFVQGRLESPNSTAGKRRMPSDHHGLYDLAKQMVGKKRYLWAVLRHRTCGVWGRDPGNAMLFTARMWLQAMLSGRDLMSDQHSPVAQASFSHTVWKSMGNWRMHPEESGRVYLECRTPTYCIDTVPTRGRQGSVLQDAIGAIASKMADFDTTIQKSAAKSDSRPGNPKK